jgi:hypothetical protein
MNRQIESISAYFAAATLILIIWADTCTAGEAAPHTKDAYVSLERAFSGLKPPTLREGASAIEKERARIGMFREVFRLAGYDFDATIRKVAHDLKDNPGVIPRNSESVATMIVFIMSAMKSDCEHQKSNCLALFDYETSESIRLLWGDR